jgi:nucleoid-associated protein YgaU
VAAEPAPPLPAVETSGRVHVVRSGETLWSIAAALLGEGASPGRIATVVDRLWSLNADRIRSGEPDLIMPGERLMLPVRLD